MPSALPPTTIAISSTSTAIPTSTSMACASSLPRCAGDGEPLGAQLAVLIDGAYTSAAHLGPDGPAAAGLGLARYLVQEARTRP